MESISGGALYHLTSRQEVVEELIDLAFGPFQVIRVFIIVASGGPFSLL